MTKREEKTWNYEQVVWYVDDALRRARYLQDASSTLGIGGLSEELTMIIKQLQTAQTCCGRIDCV